MWCGKPFGKARHLNALLHDLIDAIRREFPFQGVIILCDRSEEGACVDAAHLDPEGQSPGSAAFEHKFRGLSGRRRFGLHQIDPDDPFAVIVLEVDILSHQPRNL